jgi:hypothetical protein
VDVKRVRLFTEMEKHDRPFELTRTNTGRIDPTPRFAAILDDPENQAGVKALADLLTEGKLSAEANTPEGREQLRKVCEELGMAQTAQLAKKNALGKIEATLEKMQPGTRALAFATGGKTLAVDAVLEVARFAGQVPERVTGLMRGRNIRAQIGTPVRAFVRETVEIVNG